MQSKSIRKEFTVLWNNMSHSEVYLSKMTEEGAKVMKRKKILRFCKS